MDIDKNNQIGRMIKIAIEIGILLFAVGIAWATLGGKVVTNTKDILVHKERILKTEERIYSVQGDIREIKIFQGIILKEIKAVKEKLDE